jgi:arylsulfatase A-like enzyme
MISGAEDAMIVRAGCQPIRLPSELARRGCALLAMLLFACSALIASSVFAAEASEGKEAKAAKRPNLIFIMADDLGYGDIGCFGQKRIKTPRLDAMAEQGLKFTDFYAGCTVCAPSRCVLMTGYHTGHALIRGNAKQNLRPEDVTLAEVLKSAGYATGLAGKWGLGHEGSAGVPTRQGFDFFYGYLDQHHAHNYYPAYLMRGEAREELKNVVPGSGEFGSGVATEKHEYSHDLIATAALKFVDDHKDEPFFLYWAMTMPHANNEAKSEGMEVPALGEYANTDWPAPQKGHAAMITRMDADIGRMFDKLKALGLDNNTLVIFTSDNGPHAEGGNNPQFNQSSGPLRGIKRSLTEGGIRVPTIARWPGMVKAASTTNFVGGFQDVMPTFAQLAGASPAVPKSIDGLSFVPTLLGHPGEQQQHDYLYWAFYEGGSGQAARAGDWKAVQQPINSPVRLYNLASDLGENRDVAAAHPDVVKRLTADMQAAYIPSERWSFKSSAPANGGKKRKNK